MNLCDDGNRQEPIRGEEPGPDIRVGLFLPQFGQDVVVEQVNHARGRNSTWPMYIKASHAAPVDLPHRDDLGALLTVLVILRQRTEPASALAFSQASPVSIIT